MASNRMFRNIFNTFTNCFKIPELKSRILFTLGLLAVCRLIAYIRIPGFERHGVDGYLQPKPRQRRIAGHV